MVFNFSFIITRLFVPKKELLISIPEKKSKLHANQALKEKNIL